MNNIADKLIKIMAECAYVQKHGVNDFHKYKYATAADILDKVNAALVRNKVAAAAEAELIDFRETVNSKGNTEHLATVRTALTLIDADSGESIVFTGLGSGQDVGDKAIMKAETAALKYAYMLSLAISTGEDPEADGNLDERNDKPADRKLIACVDCGSAITSGVQKVSLAKYKKTLCMSCQRKIRSA